MSEIKYANCFVCGPDNDTGLRLDFTYEDGKAITWFDSPSRFEGYEGVIHGGIIAALLDEVMAKVILAQDLTAVTADLHIRYRKPLPVGQKVKVTGCITLQKTRTIHAAADLTDEKGVVYAEADAVYIIPKKEI